MSRVNPKVNSFTLGMFLHSDVDDAGLDVYEFRVWGRLCRRAGDNGRVFESAKKMAQGCQMSEKRVRQALHDLKERGWLELIPRYREDGSQTTNDVILIGPRWHHVPAPLVPDTSPPGTTYRPEVNPSEGYPSEEKTLVISPDGEARADLQTAQAGQEQHPQTPDLPSQEQRQTNGKASRQSKTKGVEDVPGGAAALLALWNEHRGPLPRADTLTNTRAKALTRLHRMLGDSAPSIFTDAVREAALDPFWKERRYGLDNLLSGDKVVGKAEAYRARKDRATTSPMSRRKYD